MMKLEFVGEFIDIFSLKQDWKYSLHDGEIGND